MADDDLRILADAAPPQRVALELDPSRLPGVGTRRRQRRRSSPRAASGGSRARLGAPRATRRRRGRARHASDAARQRPSANSGAKTFNLYTWAEYDDPDLMSSVRQHHDRRLQLERGGHRRSWRRPGAPAATTWSCPTGVVHPADGEQGSARTARPQPHPELQEPRRAYTNQTLGSRATSTGCARTGAPPAGSTTRRSSRRRS